MISQANILFLYKGYMKEIRVNCGFLKRFLNVCSRFSNLTDIVNEFA